VARAAGVSPTTASLALNHHPRVALRTQQRIAETAARLGFVANHLARRLARSRSDSRSTSFDQIGLIYLPGADIHVDRVCLAMMSGAEHELSKLHASLTFVRVNEQGDWKKVERLMRAGVVDGWLLVGALNDEVLNRLKAAQLFQARSASQARAARGGKDRVPCVTLGDHRCAQPVHCVNVDNAAAGRLAAQHLASLGHRRIAFLGGDMQFVYQEQTLAGFRATVKELGLDDDERLIGNASLWNAPNAELIIEWLRNTGPTAVFTPEFDWASEMCRILKQTRVQVPKEISLLAYEPVSPTARAHPFARIELPMDEVGKQGAMLLHQMVLDPRGEPREIKIPPLLIEGWSTGQCKMDPFDRLRTGKAK